MSLTDHAQEVKQEKRGGVYEYTDHPIAELFPLMSDADLAELAKDINENGQREDIVVYQGKILDGRNRYRACLLADVEPRVTSYVGTQPVLDVLSWNLHRRHLTPGQRAAIATDVLPLLEPEARERKVEGAKKGATIGGKGRPGKTPDRDSANLHGGNPETEREHRAADDAAAMLGVSARSVATAKALQQEAPELLEKVRAGEVSLNAADQQVKQAKRKKKEDARPVHDFRVLAIHPDWNTIYTTPKRIEIPRTSEPSHVFLVVDNERVGDGFNFIFRHFGMEPVCAFSVGRPLISKDMGFSIDTYLVLYAITCGDDGTDEPEWINGGPQSTRETGDLSEFWQKVESWTDGPRVSVGFEAEGFKCLPL